MLKSNLFYFQIKEIVKEYETERKDELNENLINLVTNNLKLDSDSSAKKINNRNNNTKNDNGKNQESENDTLIDLAPLSFSKSEFLDKINDQWLQRTAYVMIKF